MLSTRMPHNPDPTITPLFSNVVHKLGLRVLTRLESASQNQKLAGKHVNLCFKTKLSLANKEEVEP